LSQLYRIALTSLGLVLSACTTMGQHHASVREHFDFGPQETLSVCLYVDHGISEDTGRALVESAWKDESKLYAINVKVVNVTQWSRPAFGMDGILADLRQKPLEAPCDRVLALVGRNFGDFLWSLIGPEILGAVNTESLTHGYAAAKVASLNQILNSPSEIIEHEIYHMLGCGQHADMNACYQRIADLKRWKRESGTDFFPSWDLVNNRMLASRADVNARLAPFAARSVAAN
jgi:hypothetical protein